MNVDELNSLLLAGEVDRPGALPRLDALARGTTRFRLEFGLDELPTEPGVISLRGPRQLGKSTWLESQLRATIVTFGPGTALYLDGDHLRDADEFAVALSRLSASFRRGALVRRLFIDEITTIPDWERGLKRVLDRGELRDVLVVTTGSRAADLRRGHERLPGRKGKLSRTTYHALPISYSAFLDGGGDRLGPDALAAYLLSGGSPPAAAEVIEHGRLGAWVVDMVRDWIIGEVARSGRQRRALLNVMEQLHRHGGTALGQTKLARDAGLANNTVAAGWIELLADLQCVGISSAWDHDRRVENPRKPAKWPFTFLLVATAFAPEAPRSPAELIALPPVREALWHEWAVAQELFRRRALAGVDEPERLPYWQSADHEIDFVTSAGWVEVKRGRAGPLDFAWFPRVFPRRHLVVVSGSRFATDHVTGVTLADFLRERAPPA